MTYNKYGLASIEAVKLINEVRTLTAEKDWDIATEKIFGKSKRYN